MYNKKKMNKNIYIMQGKAKNQSNFYQYKNERITREKIKTKQKIESKVKIKIKKKMQQKRNQLNFYQYENERITRERKK